MKKSILIMFFISFSNTVIGQCLPASPPGWGGWYPIQIENWAWEGTMSPNFSAETLTIKNDDGSLVGTYPITEIDSFCPTGTTGRAVFKVPNLGDGNVWGAVEAFSGYNNWQNEVLWYGVIYVRTN